MPREPLSDRKMQTTSLHLPSDLLYLLRIIAVRRASRSGGRPSVSDVVREMLEDNRQQLEIEASPPSDRPGDHPEHMVPVRSNMRTSASLRVTPAEQSSVRRSNKAGRIRRRTD
jgi:hypothetical protein